MIYDSLKLFLDQFCEPASCSSDKGMEFAAKADLIDYLPSNCHIWLFISPDFSTLTIKLICDDGGDHYREEVSLIPIVQASFDTVIREIERLKECTLP